VGVKRDNDYRDNYFPMEVRRDELSIMAERSANDG
jgi:hypothetical protein